jgi:hypothetical protein
LAGARGIAECKGRYIVRAWGAAVLRRYTNFGTRDEAVAGLKAGAYQLREKSGLEANSGLGTVY